MPTQKNLTIFGVPNHTSLPYSSFGTTSPGVVPAGYEASYLKTEEPTDTARINTLDPMHTQWIFNIGVPSDVRGMALVNHNLYRGSQIRWMAPVGNVTYTYTINVPTSVSSAANVTGDHTRVDETITTPDGNQVAPVLPGQGWFSQFAFGAFASPRTGVDLGMVVLRSKRTIVSGTELLSPAIVVELFENATPIRLLGYRAVRSTSSGGQIFFFPFDFSELSDPTGTNLEIRVSGFAGVNTLGGLGSYCNLEVLNVYFESELQYPTPFTYDSGWITVESEDSVSSNLLEPTKSNHYVPTTDWLGVTDGVIAIRSDQSDHAAPLNGGGDITLGGIWPVTLAVSDSLTYIEAGVAPIGSGLTLQAAGLTTESPASYGIAVENLDSGHTLGGQSYGASSWRRRHTPPLTVVVTRDELKTLQQMYWTRGNSGAVYVVLEPDLELTWQKFSAFWATIKSLSEPREIYYAPGSTAQFKITIEFEEKL